MIAPDDPHAALAFVRGLICAQYLLGHRNAELLPSIELPAPARASGETLVKYLSHPERTARARALAAEVAVLARALQNREIA